VRVEWSMLSGGLPGATRTTYENNVAR
jgi:hypothetical protein